jgi:hypothetical protein
MSLVAMSQEVLYIYINKTDVHTVKPQYLKFLGNWVHYLHEKPT